ncbi:MAG: oligosaccharide flippase family protein [Ferruginibacter sp.]
MSSFKARLLKGLAWRFSYYLSAFVLNIFIAHYFGAAKSGIFYLLLNNLAYVVLIFSLGIDASITYFNARKEIDINQLMSLSLFWSLGIFFFSIIFYLLADSFNLLYTHPLKIFCLFYVTGSLITSLLSSIVFSTHNNKTPNLFFIVLNTLLVLCLIFQPFWPGIAFDNVFIKIYLSSALLPALFLIIFLIFKGYRVTSKMPSLVNQKKFIQFAFQSFIFALLYALLLRFDYWLVNYFSSGTDLGNYIQTTKLNPVILLIPTLASYSLFPLVVSEVHEQKEIETKLVKLINLYFFTGLLICVCIVATGYWLFPFLYGNSFKKMYSLFLLLAPGTLMLAAAYPLTTFFSGKNLMKINIQGIIIAIVIILILDILFIPGYGVYGAAIASTIAYTFYFFYLVAVFKKLHPLKLAMLFNFKTMIKYIISYTGSEIK